MNFSITATLLAGVLLAGSAFAQPKNPVQPGKLELGPGINAEAYDPAFPVNANWPTALQGDWFARADDAVGTLQGKLTLGKDKKLKMEPAGMYALSGYWHALAGAIIVFDTPLGKAEMRYTFKEKGVPLTLTYANGLVQRFYRGASSASPAPSTPAKAK